jgi:hypothetical protein
MLNPNQVARPHLFGNSGQQSATLGNAGGYRALGERMASLLSAIYGNNKGLVFSGVLRMRSPGFSSWSAAEGSASAGFFARSESGVAPGYAGGGWGALWSLGIGFLVPCVIFHCFFAGDRAAPSVQLFISSNRHSIGLARTVRLVQTAQVRQLIWLGAVQPESSAQTGLL